MTWPIILLLSASWLALFNQLRLVWEANEQYGYGWFVPLLAAVLLYKRGQSWEGVAPSRPPRWPGAFAAVAGVVLLLLLPVRVLEKANPDWRMLMWLHAGALVGLTLLALHAWRGRAAVRHFGFPVFFCLTAVAWPSRVDDWLTQNLMRQVAKVTVEVVGLFDVPAIPHGSTIEIANGSVGIDEACSGIRSFQTSIMLALLLGELLQVRFWRRVLLLGLGVVVALVANVGRTSFLTWCAGARGFDTMHAFHDGAGLAVVGVVLSGSVLFAWLLAPKLPPPGPVRGRVPSRPGGGSVCVCPAAWVLAACGWVAATEGLAWGWFHVGSAVSTPAPAWRLAWPSNETGFASSTLPARTVEMLGCTESRQGSWVDDQGNRWSCVYSYWPPDPKYALFVGGHNPEGCMTGGGRSFLQLAAPITIVTPAGAITFKHRLFREDSPLHQISHVFQGTWEPFVPSSGQRLFDDRSLRGRLRNALERRLVRGGITLELFLVGPPGAEEAAAAFRSLMPRLISTDVRPGPSPAGAPLSTL